MSEDQKTEVVDLGNAPFVMPKVDNAIEKLFHLALRHETCAERWSTTNEPPVEVLLSNAQKTLAETILTVWRRDKALLTNLSLDTELQSNPKLGRRERLVCSGLYDKCRSAVTARPDDFPTLSRAVMAEAGQLDRQAKRADVLEAMKALEVEIRNPSQTSLENLVQKVEALTESRGDRSGLPLASRNDYETTDAGNARLFSDHYGNDCKYVGDWRAWLTWNGKYWERDVADVVRAKALRLATKDMLTVVPTIKDDEKRTAYLKHCASSQSRFRIDNMVSLAQSFLAVRAHDLDQNGMVLNVKNGTVDLESGELRPHKREDLITKVSPVTYDQAATCPVWESFIGRIFQDADGKARPALVDYVQKVAGYSLTGNTSEQCMFILYGNGANGKTTFVNAISYIAGDYALRGQQSLLLSDGRGKSNSEDEANLFGARLVACDETAEGQRFDESKLKRLVGSGRIRARRLYENSWEFEPTHKILLDCNHLPRIAGTDLGIWRRIKPVPFLQTIPEAERDGKLADKLKAEASGILNWMLEGLRKWKAEGLTEPMEVKIAVKDYKDGEDIFGRFLTECTLQGAAESARSSYLYLRYQRWCEGNGLDHPLTAPAFSKKMTERNYEKRHTEFGTAWNGLSLLEETATTSSEADEAWKC